MLTMVNNKERKYGMAEEYRNCMYQKLETLFPQNIVMNQKQKDAEYLTHQFQNKFITNSVPDRIFQKTEDLYLCSLQYVAGL